MIKKKLKGTVLGLIAAATVMSGSTGVLAADPTSFNNSTSSSVSSSNVFTAGSDTSQGKTGSMTDKSMGGTTSTPTESTSQSVSVYATKASSVSIKVPQVLIGNSTKSEYLVGVKGDVTPKQSVTVAPSATFTLTDINDSARSKTAKISQTKTNWSYSDLSAADAYVYTKGTITYDELKAGSYSGVFNLAVSLNYTK